MIMAGVLKIVLVSVYLVVFIESKTLTTYITKCSLKNDFSKCGIDAGNVAIHQFLHGDKENKISDLDPLRLPALELKTSGLTLSIYNVTVRGIQNVNLKSISFDENTKKLSFDLHLDNLRIEGHHKVDGKVLVLPIKGEGHGILDFIDGVYSFSFDLTPVMKNGKEVIKVENPQLKTHFGGVKFELRDLFQGNEQLGREMNKFLNDNWDEVIKEFHALVEAPITEVVYAVVSSLLNGLPYDEVFNDL